MNQEPQYFDCDDSGLEPEDKRMPTIPKWRQTQTQFQVDVLDIFSMKYFPKNDRDAKTDLIEIERSMAPLNALPGLNAMLQKDKLVYPFPKEWVDFAINWTIAKRKENIPITLRGLINFLKNKDRMVNWLEKNGSFVYTIAKKHKMNPIILKEMENASLEEKYPGYLD